MPKDPESAVNSSNTAAVPAKTELRRKLRAQREALSEAEWVEHCSEVCRHLMQHPWLQGARGVALFEPLLARKELDLRPLVPLLGARGVSLYYPAVESAARGLADGTFRRVDSDAELIAGPFGLRQPAPSATVARPTDIDVILVPCLAVDAQGYRVGYGSGFYDRCLQRFAPPARSIAVAFSFQLCEAVPHDVHDVACDLVVTERGAVER